MLLIGLSVLLKLENYLFKVIHLFTHCFANGNFKTQTRDLFYSVFWECSILQLIPATLIFHTTCNASVLGVWKRRGFMQLRIARFVK